TSAGEGLGWGSSDRDGSAAAASTTPTPRASRATLPTRGRAKTEFAACSDPTPHERGLRATPAGHRQGHAPLLAELLARVVVRMWLGRSRHRHARVGDRLILRQPLPAHLGAARRGRRRVDGVAAGFEYRAVTSLGRALADIAAAHVARETFPVALERRAEAAAAAGAQDMGIASVQDLVERLAVMEALFLRGGETVDRDRIAGTAEPAFEAPRLALHPIHLRVETKVVTRLHHLLAAEPAAEAA